MPKKIFIFVLPGLGDVLLATPLIHSIKQTYPEAKIDLMIRQGTEGILEGNSDINQIFTCQKHSPVKDYFAMFKNTAFKYDLAFSLSASDRSFWCTLFAAKKRYSIIKKFRWQDFWKHLGTHKYIFDSENIHVVERNLRLADAAGIKRNYQLIPPATTKEIKYPDKKFIVLHPFPRLPFKYWKIIAWQTLIDYLQKQDYQIVISGGKSKKELDYIKPLLTKNIISIAGKLTLAETAKLISRAEFFIGVDTGTSHLAAATGVKTITLFGPTNISRWSPFPKDYLKPKPPFKDIAGIQNISNVTIISANCTCKNILGKKLTTDCHNHEQAESDCMQEIQPEEIIKRLMSCHFHLSTKYTRRQ